MNMENKLFGKTVIWNGDSICQGSSRSGTWADRIAAKNGLAAWKNYGIGGGTVTENVLVASTGKIRHSVSATLEKMHEEFPDADYIIFEGGTNDADLLGRITEGNVPERFGAVDPYDYSGNYDRDSFCGALESVFYRATQYWRGKKICYIVAQKMGYNPPTSKNRRAYFEVAMQICRKWGIPYLNLWDGCYLNPELPWMFDRNKTIEENEVCSLYKDGQHLTAAGYDLTADIIDSFLKTL
ncbi:MAG: SGNH/GDSL hydrolase family protein [Clostridia bacterium]|nr:SGNH/GDSL hydrolase family protein [Clostridia bacterium]